MNLSKETSIAGILVLSVMLGVGCTTTTQRAMIAEAASQEGEAEENGTWYYSKGGGESHGPVTEETLVEKIRNGKVTANATIRKVASSEWRKVDRVEPFKAEFESEKAAAKTGSEKPEETAEGGEAESETEGQPGDEKTAGQKDDAQEPTDKESAAAADEESSADGGEKMEKGKGE